MPFSAALVVGTFYNVMGTTDVSSPIAVVGTILVSVAGGIVANEVGAISTAIPPCDIISSHVVSSSAVAVA